jgi:predicted kinase
MDLFKFAPRPPEWRLDWGAIDREYEWVRAMAGCPQSPEWHAEGDVHIHTRMVLEALLGMPAWRSLPEGEREVVFAACLLHDVSKPECTRVEPDGRISSRGHSRRGAIRAREILWRMGVPFRKREAICALVLHHQVPFTLIDRQDAERTAIAVSQETRCDLLALVTEADGRGRRCADQARLLDNIGLYAEAVKELGCWQEPFSFPSAHARFLFFRDPGRSRHAPAHEDIRCEVTVMSGLPGAGKDRWIGAHAASLPRVSLDGIREELDVDPAEIQSRVIEEARDRAREHLRSGRGFVWNATNLSADMRSRIIELCAGYKARVRIVYVESPASRLFQQNRGRERTVPEEVLLRLLRRWTVPTLLEAHEVLLGSGTD